MFVLLFDIDGTLVHTGGAGMAALDCAFRAEFGITIPRKVPVSGRTDRGIVRHVFQLHGIDDSPENWERFRIAYLQQLPQHLPLKQGHVLPGVVELLERLADHQHVAIGLLTGNVRDGARIKLEYFKLFHHFPFGGFGDDHYERNDVAHAALVASHAHLNGKVAKPRVWVIGDTPLDVRCGRWIKAQTIAVATGTFPKNELAAERPDVLLDDLSDTASLLSLIVSHAS
jgi:phosphoglycolate phosphatase-like HAD superfamily hydrolase